MGEPLVVVKDLHKSFVHMGRELHVLRGIDLTIFSGDVIAIVGKSGAGKSTLLHCIGTLDIPSSGGIRIGQDELTGLSGAKLASIRNRTIGFVFQFHHLLPEFTALENVMMPGMIQGRSKREMEGPARQLLEEVGLGKRGSHRPGELSGGEQQRVALARALVLSPKLILADEPTGNLDTTTSEAMHNLFFEINEKHGTTIVVVTHNPTFADSMPRVVRMRDGKVESDERRTTDHRRPSGGRKFSDPPPDEVEEDDDEPAKEKDAEKEAGEAEAAEAQPAEAGAAEAEADSDDDGKRPDEG